VRVGLDARALTSEVRSGVEHYVANLVRALSLLKDAPEIIAYTDRRITDPETARAASSGSISTRVIRARYGWLRVALPWRLWRERVDLVHLPSTVIPPFLPCPAVVTVHDLAWARYPETYELRDLRMQFYAVSGAAVRAAHIITVSESTAHDLQSPQRAFRARRPSIPEVAASKISVTPLGVTSEFSPEGPAPARNAFPEGRILEKGYVLYAGALQPRKNLLRLLAAYAKVRSEMTAPPLVLAGSPSAHGEQLKDAARKLGLERSVVFPGYVPGDQLPALYRGATVFVYPSLYEGFGLPVLEAMACGVPVVTSDVSSMPEVADDAALLVDPESVDRLAWAISVLLLDRDLRSTLIRRGLARSRQFTWEQTARLTVDVYQRLAQKRK